VTLRRTTIGNSDIATKTGNSYITGNTTNSVEIPTASSGFSTIASPNTVSSSNCGKGLATGNGNVANKTGNTYISGAMTDRMTIPTANLVFSTKPSAKKLTPGDCDNDRQPEMAIWMFCLPILQFLLVDRCRNHLANLLSSSTSSKIQNLALEFRRYLSEVQICNYFRFGGHIDIFGCRSLLYLLANTIFGRHFRLSVIITLPASLPWSNAVGSALQLW